MAYSNPIGKGLVVGRIDEGVDFSGSGPLYALGDGVITSIADSGWPGTNYILLHMDDGRNVYYAENLAPTVHAGQRVKGGQQIATARGSYPFIEIGWATSTPGVAAASSHYTEGQQTSEGKDFAALLGTFGIKVSGAQASPGSNYGTGTTQAAAGIGNPLSGILSLPSEITGFFSEADKFITALMWILNPASWLRIGSFLIAIVLLIGAIVVFTHADEKLSVAPVPVPI